MREHESNALAAWQRAFRRGSFNVAGDIEPETCADRWPAYNAQELCMQAAQEAIADGESTIVIEHFDRAAETLDAVDDDSGAGEPVGLLDADDSDEIVEQLEATVDDLERRVDRLEAIVIHGEGGA